MSESDRVAEQIHFSEVTWIQMSFLDEVPCIELTFVIGHKRLSNGKQQQRVWSSRVRHIKRTGEPFIAPVVERLP